MLAQLRKTISTLERPPGLEDPGVEPLGIPAIDAVLGGGLARGALHEIAAASEANIAAATGFALGLVPSRKRIVWVAEDMALFENGLPCGTGLDEFGIAPECLITVAAARSRDLFWAMEEALRCRAVGTVIGELRHETVDTVALRRLSLAAQEHGALALLLRATPSDDALAATTRWIVAAARSYIIHGPGLPRFTAQLVRNRRGLVGTWELEWSVTDECFVIAAADSQSLARPVLDRPSRPTICVA